MKKIFVVWSLVILCGLFKGGEAPAHNISKTCMSALSLALNEKWDQAYQVLPAQGCPLTADVIQWLDLKNDHRHHTFQNYRQFIEKHPDWPWMFMLRKRAESKIDAQVPDADIIAWYRNNPVQNSKSAQRYIESLINAGERSKAHKVIRQTWVNLDFDVGDENRFKAAYKALLTLADHQARTDRLLWEGKTRHARRMLLSLGAHQRLLADARIALIDQAPDAGQKLAKVPKSLKNNLGLIYDQVCAYHKTDNLEAAYLLVNFKPNPAQLKEHQKVWWKECSYFAREALNQRKAQLAYQVLAHHQSEAGEKYVECEWFLGWVALSFLNEPKTALRHFNRMHNAVKTPLSRAKVDYWRGRTAEARGDQEAARKCFEAASRAPTTYYGQLALAKVDPGRKLKLVEHLPVAARDKQAFEKYEFVRIIRLFAESGHAKEAMPFLYLLGERAPNRSQRFLALELTKEALPSFAVKAVKRAERVELPMVAWSYPTLPFKNETTVEKALILAVIRQESDFDPTAVSAAGAMGLMQVMPDTAQKVAKEMGLPYQESRLTADPVYNAQLGSHYLNKKLQQFEGAYVLAIASYNAGAKPVHEWIRRNGDPREKGCDLVNWIEMIPYGETRTYVQRVLANRNVYLRILERKG